MASGLKLRKGVVDAKAWLAAGREKLKKQHEAGTPGIQVCAHLTDLLDTVVLELWEAALEDLAPQGSAQWRSQLALVPHGGYGRRDMAPYSDVDLMILYEPGVSSQVPLLAKRLLHDLFDVGLMLGQSVRTPADACQMAWKDATVFTSLVESRYLAGSAQLYTRFARMFERAARRRWRGLLSAIQQARSDERLQYGETVYLLEPNVKRTRGGLRDIQLLRWSGFARYASAEPDSLQLLGVLSREDQRALRRSSEFLLQLRNELHFHAKKSHDVLDRAEQVRIAQVQGYQQTEGLLPVEQFMRQYFRHTNEVSHIVSRFVTSIRPWTRLEAALSPIFSHQVERDFRVGPRRITATKRGLQKLRGDLAEVLRLTDLANLYNKSIAHETWEAVHAAAPDLPDVLSAAAAQRFLSLVSQPARLGELLRNLHELGVLEKIIPSFKHAKCLLQFNEYHKYTVDEHCIRAVERATEFLADTGPLGQVYRGIKEKRTLHLALLLHDLGKGFLEDHSEVGLRIAQETAERLRLPSREADALKFLVHKHLVMSHLAFRRDTSEDQLIVRFAFEVGSPEMLRMLFVLTAADLGAVGPGVFTDWKAEVLTDLYSRTMQHLAGDSPAANTEERRAAVRALLSRNGEVEDFKQEINTLPRSYLYCTPPEKIAAELQRLKQLAAGEVEVWNRFLPESCTIEFTIGTQEAIVPGVFHKLTGALTSQGLQILSADINTLADRLVLDRFVVIDPDYSGQPPIERLEQVHHGLVKSLRADAPPAFRKTWRTADHAARTALMPLPTQVRADNSTSDRFTILDIFASDRMGLLYTIARTLFELNLSVSLAKISTHLDQVVDVFYVTDLAGRKIANETRLQAIRARLLEAIDSPPAD